MFVQDNINMGKGIFEQIQNGNIHNYSGKITSRQLKEALDAVYGGERFNISEELDNLTNIDQSQLNIIRELLYSKLEEDFVLAKELINILKTK